MPGLVSDARWSQLSEFVAETTGLHFPRERWADLQRGLEAAARELRFEDLATCAEWLLSTPANKAQLQVLASHLTVGETYFLREKKTFEVLASRVLPELVRSRRGREQRLRLWSAGCCTGEEPYSLAMLLHQVIPDLSDWHVTILATDINARFLRKAVAGSYSQWSFRDTPAWLKERYFSQTADGRYAIVPEVKKMVTFEHLNLVEDTYPSLATDTNAMDVIFCRNVMMYFTPAQVRKVIRNLHHALVEGGWLVVSPSEASHALFPQFTAANHPGVILYQKSDMKLHGKQAWMPAPLGAAAECVAPAVETPSPWSLQVPVAVPAEPPPPLKKSAPAETPPTPLAAAQSHYQEGRYAEAADALLASIDGQASEPAFSLLAHSLANLGRLDDALRWCERWIAADKLNPAPYYLCAMVVLEQGAADQAKASLQRSLYLQPDFVLAHFALGNIARGSGKSEESRRHFTNALHLLGRCQPHEILPEAEGLTAGRLAEIITSMSEMETTP
jgi:chemotaxis protein methyltransferase CheR